MQLFLSQAQLVSLAHQCIYQYIFKRKKKKSPFPIHNYLPGFLPLVLELLSNLSTRVLENKMRSGSPRESPAPNSPTWEQISKNSACRNQRSSPESSPGAAAGHEGTGKVVRENVCDAHTHERDDTTFPACDFHLWVFLQTPLWLNLLEKAQDWDTSH